jgi:small subunit ribosomal protein S1
VVADYGAFAEILPGVEGLIHVSEMSWSQHLRTAQDFLKVGEEIEAVVLTLDREERKMSLGIKQLSEDPWAKVAAKYAVGTQHTATVRNFSNFGIFVEMEEGVDGLIHISDLSWSKKIKHPSEFCKVGDKIEVKVLELDLENRKLSLGHKQLEENPWDVFETVFGVGSVHQGTVISINDKGGVIALPYGVEGFAPVRHLQKTDKTTARVEDNLPFKVLEFNKESKKILLSHSKINDDAIGYEKEKVEKDRKSDAESTKKTVKRMKDSLEKTTLGDISALAALKEELNRNSDKQGDE